ncbi:MAG TPA: hypothetical protein VIA02_08615 [Candidatus Limnocylindria bacterium]|jgi:hypothetical protein
MGRSGALGWVMVTVGVVLIVLGVVLGGATWGTTIMISVFGLVLVGVGALMAMRARRQAGDTSDSPTT